MFSLMGHYYPWASPDAISRLTVKQLQMYMRGLPELERRRHVTNARVAWLIARTMGGNTKSTETDWLPEFAASRRESGGSMLYPPEVARDIRSALRLRLITQYGLDDLGGDDVRNALAYLKEREGGE